MNINPGFKTCLSNSTCATTAGSRKARQAADKFAKYTRLWELADTAIREVDVEFADAFTALAVTYGFHGSPHIDKQNIGPFYGLALGEFAEGQGGICVVGAVHFESS
jgi:hypothetical protein